MSVAQEPAEGWRKPVSLLYRKTSVHPVNTGSSCFVSAFVVTFATTDHLENYSSCNLESFSNVCFLGAVGCEPLSDLAINVIYEVHSYSSLSLTWLSTLDEHSSTIDKRLKQLMGDVCNKSWVWFLAILLLTQQNIITRQLIKESF